jgi:putative transposase
MTTPVAKVFMKTLKREEIYANDYRDLKHLLGNIEAFIEEYYL